MRILKALLIGFTALFIIITLFSLLIPSSVRVSRFTVIDHTSSGAVYRQVANFENWKNWHPVFTIDSATLYSHSPVMVGKDLGCVIRHRGKDITIKLIKADTAEVRFLLRAEGENDIANDIVITALPAQKAVQVEWKAVTRLHWYPWEKVYGIFIDKLTGPGYDAALKGLKEYIERSPALPGGEELK